jgi:hypothetical protein
MQVFRRCVVNGATVASVRSRLAGPPHRVYGWPVAAVGWIAGPMTPGLYRFRPLGRRLEPLAIRIPALRDSGGPGHMAPGLISRAAMPLRRGPVVKGAGSAMPWTWPGVARLPMALPARVSGGPGAPPQSRGDRSVLRALERPGLRRLSARWRPLKARAAARLHPILVGPALPGSERLGPGSIGGTRAGSVELGGAGRGKGSPGRSGAVMPGCDGRPQA